MKNDRQHDDLESNLAILTGTSDCKIIWFVSRTVSVYCRNEITCSGCVFRRMIVNTIVEINLTALEGSLRSQYRLRHSGAQFS